MSNQTRKTYIENCSVTNNKEEWERITTTQNAGIGNPEVYRHVLEQCLNWQCQVRFTDGCPFEKSRKK